MRNIIPFLLLTSCTLPVIGPVPEDAGVDAALPVPEDAALRGKGIFMVLYTCDYGVYPCYGTFSTPGDFPADLSRITGDCSGRRVQVEDGTSVCGTLTEHSPDFALQCEAGACRASCPGFCKGTSLYLTY